MSFSELQNSLSSHIGLANQLQQTLPNCFFTDQYSNPANPRVHYKETAEEILYQCDHKVDMLVAGVGTGGTLTGVAHKMKEKIPTCKVSETIIFLSYIATTEKCELATSTDGNLDILLVYQHREP